MSLNEPNFNAVGGRNTEVHFAVLRPDAHFTDPSTGNVSVYLLLLKS